MDSPEIGEGGRRTAGPSTAHRDRYALSKNISTKGPRNCRSLHGTPHGKPGQAGQAGQVCSPRFPVESCGFDSLHVFLFKENHKEANELR